MGSQLLILSKKNTKINKVIIFSKKKKKIFNKTDNKNISLNQIFGDISRIKKLPYADLIIYCPILKNLREDHLAAKNYYKIALKYHCKSKILFTSSGAVYGPQPSNLLKIKENYQNDKNAKFLNKQKNLYSIIKIQNENIFKQLSLQGLKISIARCFAFVGVHIPLNKLYAVGNFMHSVINKKPLIVSSDYKVIRSYMHSDDLAEWLLKILNNASNKLNIFNVGSDKLVDLRVLAKKIASKFNLPLILKKITSTETMVDRYVPNTSKAKKKLKLKNKYANFIAILKTIRQLEKVKNKL